MPSRITTLSIGLFGVFACAFVAGACSERANEPSIFMYFFLTLSVVNAVNVLRLGR